MNLFSYTFLLEKYLRLQLLFFPTLFKLMSNLKYGHLLTVKTVPITDYCAKGETKVSCTPPVCADCVRGLPLRVEWQAQILVPHKIPEA